MGLREVRQHQRVPNQACNPSWDSILMPLIWSLHLRDKEIRNWATPVDGGKEKKRAREDGPQGSTEDGKAKSLTHSFKGIPGFALTPPLPPSSPSSTWMLLCLARSRCRRQSPLNSTPDGLGHFLRKSPLFERLSASTCYVRVM